MLKKMMILVQLVVLTPIWLVCGLENPAVVSAQSDKFNPEGYYFVDGDPPAAFKEIDHISLFSNNKGGLTGFFETKKGKVRRNLVQVVLQGKQLSFSTTAIAGVSFKFEGKFLKDGDFSASQPEGVVLKGHFSKIQNGKALAEADLGLTYFVGD